VSDLVARQLLYEGGMAAEIKIVLAGRDRARLERRLVSTGDQRLRSRILAILKSGEGLLAGTIAAQLKISVNSVTNHRRRWRRDGIGGLPDRPRSGRPARGLSENLGPSRPERRGRSRKARRRRDATESIAEEEQRRGYAPAARPGDGRDFRIGPRATTAYRVLLVKMYRTQKPSRNGHPVSRGSARLLSKRLYRRTGIRVSRARVDGLLRELGLTPRRKNANSEKYFHRKNGGNGCRRIMGAGRKLLKSFCE
jgi:transposase